MFKQLRPNRRKVSRSGAATVEMAMVAPVLFLLIFGSVEFTRMMMVRQSLTNACREGCRHACLASAQSPTGPEEAARDIMSGVIENHATNENLIFTINPPLDPLPERGTDITVTTEIGCSSVSWLPPFFTGNTVIKTTCTMKKE